MRNFFNRLTFSLWYFFKPPWDSGISPPELLDFIENHTPGTALDIGCGTGTNVITLAQAGWQVTGVDFAPRAIGKAKRKIKNAGIDANLIVRDATDLTGINGPFDLVLDIGCFHGTGDQKGKYLGELGRLLAPDGYWLMYGFFRPPARQSGPGLVEADLDLFRASMTLVRREDGFNKRDLPSAWFLFQNNPKGLVDL